MILELVLLAVQLVGVLGIVAGLVLLVRSSS